MKDRQFFEKDDDPDVALSVLLGKTKGDKRFASICLTVAIKAGNYPLGWYPRG